MPHPNNTYRRKKPEIWMTCYMHALDSTIKPPYQHPGPSVILPWMFVVDPVLNNRERLSVY
jgi:hypothetical protein